MAIIIPKPATDSLTDQFIILYQVLSEIQKYDDTTFDFSQLEKVYPMLVLALCGIAYGKNGKFKVPKNFEKIIGFPKGTNKINLNDNQIPLLFLTNKPDLKTRDKLIDDFVETLYRLMGNKEGTKNAIFYPISELITNIFEHSRKEEGWAFAQFDAEKKCLDICIVDNGRGLRESYKQEKNLNISDADAIGQVMIGNSTKPDKERGYGVRTSKKLICKGLKGSFLIFSGKAALINENLDEKLIELDKGIWNGVILAYKIPFLKEPVSIYPFLE